MRRKRVRSLLRPLWRQFWKLIEQRLGTIEDRLSKNESRLDKLHARLEEISQTLNKNSTLLHAMQEDYPLLRNMLKTSPAYGTTLAEMHRELKNLEQSLAATKARDIS